MVSFNPGERVPDVHETGMLVGLTAGPGTS